MIEDTLQTLVLSSITIIDTTDPLEETHTILIITEQHSETQMIEMVVEQIKMSIIESQIPMVSTRLTL